MKLYLKDIPDALFLRLSARAQKAGRSTNDEVVQILRVALERPATIGFAEDAQRTLALASDEAKGLNHSYIGSEHILLGLAAGESAALAKVLAETAITTNPFLAIRGAVEYFVGHGAEPPGEELQLTPRAKKVIELAQDEACRLADSEVSSWHLLAGIMREGEGVASSVLESLGVTLRKVFDSR